MKLTSFISLAFFALLVSSCTGDKKSQTGPKEFDLNIVYTTDVHGMLLPHDFSTNMPAAISLANVKSYVDNLREKNPEGVLLMDCGDFMQGQALTYYYSYAEPHSKHIAPRAAKELGYQCFGFGANDLEVGAQTLFNILEPQFEGADFICANAVVEHTGKPICKPYAIYEMQGAKIAVLGMVTPNMEQLLPRTLWPSLEFQDMVECAQKWVPLIREQEKPDLLIGLFHSGISFSDSLQYKDPNGAIPAAKLVPGIDVLMLGHEHRSMLGNIVNVEGDTIPYIELRGRAQQVGQLDVHFKRNEDGSLTHTLNLRSVEMATQPIDQAYVAKFEEDSHIVNEYLDKKLGELKGTIDPTDALAGPSTYMDLIHDLQLWVSGADISLTNYLSLPYVHEEGDISMRTLFRLYRHVNQLYVLRLTGAEIHRYLEWSAAIQFRQMTSAKDHLIDFILNPDGSIHMSDFGPELGHPEFDWSTAGGIKYTIDVSKPAGQRVTIHSLADGSKFDMEAFYRVAVNAHQAIGGGGYFDYMHFDENTLDERLETTCSADVRLLFANFFKMHPILVPECHHNWKLIPEAWVKEASERDLKILNNH